MDNFGLDVLAEGPDTLGEIIKIAFRHNASSDHATHWAEIALPFKGVEFMGDESTTRPTLVLYWRDPGDKRLESHPFPSRITPEEAQVFVNSWLRGLGEQHRLPQEPDHDGSNGKAYRVFVEGWGHVAENSYAICAIQPTWAMHGK